MDNSNMGILEVNKIWNRTFFMSLLLIVGWESASANYSSYKFNTTLTVEPTGTGRVYATYDGNAKTSTMDTKDYPETLYDDNLWGYTATVKLVASPETGYRFVSWTDDQNEIVSRLSNTNLSQVYKTEGANYTTRYNVEVPSWIPFIGGRKFFPYNTYSTISNFSYTAHFALQGNVVAKVADGQEVIGSADILEDHLIPGREVTLQANNVNGSEFLGWFFDYWECDGVWVSSEKEIKVTVPTSEIVKTYVAHFKQTDTEFYCFLRNKATGRYLRLSDIKDYTPPSSSDNLVGAFNGSLTLAEEAKAISDPACVFVITGSSEAGTVKKASLISQGVSIGFLSKSKVISDNKNGLTLTPASSGAYYISAIYTEKQYNQTVNLPIYIRDNSGTPDLYGSRTPYTEWEILELSRATLGLYYFGASPNALLERNGKYYTTLYTTFPYELQSGRVYYVNSQSLVAIAETGNYRVVCQEIPNNIVPKESAVIIECEGSDVASNKILPLPSNTDITALSGNYLKGHIRLKNGAKTGDGNMYVLSVGSNSVLGFYKLKIGTAMTDNKVYAYLDEEAQTLAKNMSFSFGDDFASESGIITNIQEMVVLPESLTGAIVYDLQGRQVKNPTRGVYIVNGKKFVIK